MAGQSSIEWTGSTWNPVRGCSRVSEGCRNCYAEGMAARFSDEGNWGEGLAGFVTRPDGKREARWTGKVMAAPDHVLTQPLRWKAPRTIFVNSTSDLFHEDLPDDVIDRVFAVMALCSQHIFQVLTKRPERMRDYVGRLRNENDRWERLGDAAAPMVGNIAYDYAECAWPLPNVWLGTSVEDQATADNRIPHLLSTLAAIRFISAEPLLGPVDLSGWFWGVDEPCEQCPRDEDCECGWELRSALPNHMAMGSIDWVICGGESGPGARPMHPDWARNLRDQCAAANVPFFFKQWGTHKVVYDRDREDPDWRRCGDVARKSPTGEWWNLAGGTGFHGERVVRVVPTTKKAAGRLLDGVTHDGMPHDGKPSTSAGDARPVGVAS